MEDADRKARLREKREAEKQQRIQQELFEARKLQMLEKERRLADQAKQERDSFQFILAAQKVQREEELKIARERQQMLYKHSKEIRK